MEKRALIAVVISLVILVLYQEVILRRLYPPPPQEQAEPASHEEQAEPAPHQPGALVGEPLKPKPEVAPPLPAAAAPEPSPPEIQPAVEARRITVDTDLYTAVFTTKGARLESFRLKRYRTTVAPSSPPQETIVAGAGDDYPFGVELRGGEALSDAGAPYVTKSEGVSLQGAATDSLEFTWKTRKGTIYKRYIFRGDRYEFRQVVGTHGFPAEYNELGVSWDKGIVAHPKPDAEVIFDRTVYLDGRKLKENTFSKLEKGMILTGDIGWAGYAGRHFLSAVIPVDAPDHRLWLKLRDHTVEEQLLFPIAASSAELQFDVYIGAKDIDALGRVGHGLSRAVNLGWFDFIAFPMLHILRFFDRFTGNYGIAIILLTVVIKILFIPLTQRSYQSMKAMQKLQPQMTKIREKYKDNSEQMNKEIMELYRRHKVNPLGGCLPMVLQTPVFIGLYEALLNAVELRHAPFLLWINDLSAPDRLGTVQLPFVHQPGIPVLTLLMGVSMFVQQWMTPTAGDPTQQRVMMIMPLMFTFMFVNFPSGLALYWLVNNLLTIAQQYYINRHTT